MLRIGMDLSEIIRLMEVSAKLFKYIYCIFALYGRLYHIIPLKYFPSGTRSNKEQFEPRPSKQYIFTAKRMINKNE